MAYPLIIFGAGASHDLFKISRQSDQHILNAWIPPLVNDIFDVSLFSRIIGKYEDVKQLAAAVSNLSDAARTKPFDFEEYLTQLETNYPENSYKKLVALRFYLAELFSKISYHFYRHVNNHNHLLFEIQNRKLRACIVNYNYDTLLEKNMSSISGNNKIDSYIEGDIKVIKMHGAHDWRFNPEIDLANEDVYDFFTSKPQSFYEGYQGREVYPITIKIFDYSKVDFSLNAYKENKDTGFQGGGWSYYLPAIAIPIGTKGNHVCPKKHIDVLVEQIKLVDRILVIGWRAQDEFLLSLIKQHLQKKTNLTVVSGGKTKASYFVEKFKDIPKIDTSKLVFHDQGYTEFMVNEDYRPFFK